jgi:3'-5' exonuclease
VGVNIGADFKKLQKDCGLAQPFCGNVELRALAKERNVSNRKNVGLADLCGNLLHRYLKKDPTVRISSHWADAQLAQDFLDYAVMDVYATWAVYENLMRIKAPQSVSPETPRGTLVTLHATDRKPVAQGCIALERPDKCQGVNVTARRVVIIITDVLVSSYLIPGSLRGDRQSVALFKCGETPFSILTTYRALRTRSEQLGT